MPERLAAEVAVVGGGPAGIAAATRAAELGARTVLLDRGWGPGGQIWRHRERTETPAVAGWWMARLERSGAEARWQTRVVDATPAGRLLAEGPAGALRVDAERLILATGARELFLPFPGWTLPNVVGVGAALAMLEAGADLKGRRVVIAGSGPLLLPVAARLARHGARLLLVAEQAPAAAVRRFARGLWRRPRRLLAAARYRTAFLGTPYQRGSWVVEARGDERLRSVTLTDGRTTWSGHCDLLCASYGLVPNLELPRWLGCAIDGERVEVTERLETSIPGIFCAGEPTGVGGAELALVEGELAAAAVTGTSDGVARLRRKRRRLQAFARSLERTFELRPELLDRVTGETLVCRCEDVAWSRLDPEWSVRQAKLYTRVGMGPCQGRVCGPALGRLCGWEADAVRLPLEPMSIEGLAAGLLD